ncbi:MAG: TonB-dependent receptor [Bacteroidales bacterium]|nr:TonB-dependent receptor [Candidatus Cloacimonadota bacterium]MBS3771596.1 TonB-dependent receptor [Bacteroidales bacterium]
MKKKTKMLNRFFVLLVFLLGLSINFSLAVETDNSDLNQVARQQQIEVSGTVTDAETGDPLPGVNIVVQGTTTGTTTDMDGQYSIEAPADATLLFSFVGYQEQNIAINGQQKIDVTLQQAVTELEEVVAIGYGTLQRNKVSTSISSVKPESIEKQVTNSIDRSLEGQIAGLSVKQSSGAPGGGSELRIRGSGSIGAGDEPLVVVDGVPMQNTYGKEQSPLTLLNQDNIASIDVLKGVSATAIYGSRGSNGVILITTKSGETGKTEISFSAKAGIESVLPSEKLDLMNAEEFARWRKQNAYEEAAFYGDDISESDIPEVYRNPEALSGRGTDWYDVMTRVAPQHEYNLSVSHGTEDFQGFFSIGYLNNQGAIKETEFERLSMRANMDYEPNDWIKTGMKLSPTLRWWGNQVGGNRGTLFGSAMMSTPLDGPYKDDGIWERDQEAYWDGKYDLDIWSPGTFSNRNALHALKKQIDRDNDLNLHIQPYLQFNPLEALTFRSQLNMELGYNSDEYFRPSTISSIYGPPPAPTDGAYSTGRSFNWQFENTLDYEKELGNHAISALAGYTMEHYNWYGSYINGSQFPSDAIKTLNAATQYSGSTGESNWSMISYMFRLSYDYDAKYLFTGTVRRDGSSRFGPDNRWGYFPSASVGWNITKESFFPDPQWMTNLKLRASYGFSGNNAIGNYTWIPNLSEDNYTLGGSVADGKRLAGMGNPQLSWERSRELDVGLDLTLFDGRLNFVFDYYNKITEDMLWGVSVPISSGFSSAMKNIGQIRNRGVEFSINSVNISNNDFTWETNFNISFNRNKVLDLGQVERIRTGHRGYSITKEGEPMAMFYGWKSLGILENQSEVDNNATFPNQEAGTPHYVDKDGNGVIDERDKMIVGDPWPDFRGGISNSLNYRNWDFSISMSFAHNFDVWAQLEEDVLNLDGVFNVLKEVKHRWKSPEEPGNGRIAATFHQTRFDRWANSDWAHNASFLKIQNMSLGYTFDNSDFANQFRLFCSVQNAFLFTNYRYGNPDVNIYGSNSLVRNFDNYDFPLTRTVVLGLNINF